MGTLGSNPWQAVGGLDNHTKRLDFQMSMMGFVFPCLNLILTTLALAELVIPENELDNMLQQLDRLQKEAELADLLILPEECQRRVYHYWVVDAYGRHESGNATVVTPLSSHTKIIYEKDATLEIDNKRQDEEEDLIEEGQYNPHVLVLRPELNCLFQGDGALSTALLDYYLVPPPKYGFLREFVSTEVDEGTHGGSHRGVFQDQFLDEFIFKGRVKNGFFVEAGADDFLLNSNSLLFELTHKWTGVLVEPHLNRFHQGLQVGRNTWGAPVCLALGPSPHTAWIAQALQGVSMNGLVPPERGGAVHQCFPLYSLLLALNKSKVNYFSLDIEGAELQVLRSVPWHLVDIEVISVEYNLLAYILKAKKLAVSGVIPKICLFVSLSRFSLFSCLLVKFKYYLINGKPKKT